MSFSACSIWVRAWALRALHGFARRPRTRATTMDYMSPPPCSASSAILLAFMPKYRFVAGTDAPHAAGATSPAPQQTGYCFFAVNGVGIGPRCSVPVSVPSVASIAS